MALFKFKIAPKRKQFVKFIGKIYELLEDAYWQEHTRNGLTKTKLAEALGVHKSYVTRLFSGTSNMTLETLSNLAYELNRDIKIDLVERGPTIKVVHFSSDNKVVPLFTPASSGNGARVITQRDKTVCHG